MAGDVRHIGGQAVFEGVMLKTNNNLAVVVRKPKNKFSVLKKKIKKKKKLLNFPFIRGIVNLIEMLDFGIKSLLWSSNQVLGEKEKLTSKDIFFTIAGSIILTILIFLAAPPFITKFFVSKGSLFSLVEGLVRISFFLAYILLISLFSDVRTLFQYHGAEHKVVNCFESKKPLTLENAKKYSTLHKRCGTSFVIIVLILSIIIFSFVPYQNLFYRVGLKILLVPVLVSLAYEFIKLGAKHPGNLFFQIFIIPGLWLQKITTKEPTPKQLEVALRTIRVLLKMEKAK